MRLGVGLIGSGFMGKTHAFGFSNATRVFSLPVTLERAMLADIDAEQAARAAAALGFARSTGDWRRLVADAAVDIVAITTPNALHKAMALAVIAAGKHVYCEKPLAPTVDEAREMTFAAQAAGVTTAVGFNYLKNPLFKFARELIAAGEIGEIRAFNGIHAEDYMTDAEIPWSWRLDPAGGGGALADLGSHIIATARYLIGPIEEVLGDAATVIASRPASPVPRSAGRWRWRTSVAHTFASPTGAAASSKPTGSRPGARCAMISRFQAPKALSPSASSVSTRSTCI